MKDRPTEPSWSADPPGGGADPERLAALLDGRLAGAERDDLLAQLAASEDDLALFAEAAAIQRELEAENEAKAAGPAVLPLRPVAPVRRGVGRRVLALAAVLAGVALLPFAWRASRPVQEPGQAVAMLQDPAGRLPDGWVDRPAWSVTRGGPGGTQPEPRRAVRLGARMVDLEVAIRSGDVANTRVLAMQVAEALRSVSASGAISAVLFDAIAIRAYLPPAELLPLLEAESRSAALDVEAEWFALGAWTEAARLAADRGDAEFFRERRSRRTLVLAAKLGAYNPATRSAVASIRAALASDTPAWPELKDGLDRLMYAVG